MRQLIVKLGHIPSVIVITVFSCLASVCIASFIAFIWHGFDTDFVTHITIAALVPIILAPPISWSIIDLLLKINHLEVDMRKLATFDSLTGLLNRHVFLERAGYVFDLAAREGFEISILLVDLDHFKMINDNYGHACGDMVLATFGKIVNQTIRKSDIVGRLGGEEFAFLLPDTSIEETRHFSKRLHEVINDTVFDHSGCPIQITISIGIVTLPKSKISNIEKSLSMADKAMYYAKENGRNQSAIYNEHFERLEAG